MGSVGSRGARATVAGVVSIDVPVSIHIPIDVHIGVVLLRALLLRLVLGLMRLLTLTFVLTLTLVVLLLLLRFDGGPLLVLPRVAWVAGAGFTAHQSTGECKRAACGEGVERSFDVHHVLFLSWIQHPHPGWFSRHARLPSGRFLHALAHEGAIMFDQFQNYIGVRADMWCWICGIYCVSCVSAAA
ncbi:hypothetical protein ACERK3_13240 [Phycisphaerales bacterium AB-hyl4]|uniref:Uncharacterized protein n=1 Tax=Natronomicrosphaera hydrolytica TaxID=3242702 RepID=A0ABV4U8Y7_9BACT